MKRISILSIFAVLLLAGILSMGCKNTSTNPQGSAPGNITGLVQLYDTLYHPMTDNSSVSIALEGTSFHTTSDASGKWTLANVPAGIYTLVFSKDHYLTKKDQNTEFPGNGTLYYSLGGNPTTMYSLPALFPNLVLRPFEDYIQITFVRDSIVRDASGNFIKDIQFFDTVITKSDLAIFSSRSQYLYNGESISTIFFFGTGPGIDPATSASYLFSIVSYPYADTSGLTNASIHRSALLKAGFSSGATIYCSAYAFASYILNTWYDPVTNKPIYSGFSPHHSEVKSFILP